MIARNSIQIENCNLQFSSDIIPYLSIVSITRIPTICHLTFAQILQFDVNTVTSAKMTGIRVCAERTEIYV